MEKYACPECGIKTNHKLDKRFPGVYVCCVFFTPGYKRKYWDYKQYQEHHLRFFMKRQCQNMWR